MQQRTPTLSDPATLTASQAARAIASGELTATALAEALVQRTQEMEPGVRAWAHFEADQLLEAARLADAGPRRGPLHGVPFGVKDIIDTAEMPTACGTPIHRGHMASRDAACVALLREAGALVMGKTVTTELAHLHPGKTRNPLDPAHTPGGSSSGSAAAVAAGMVPFALGTQTTGSVIRPAAFCGAYGYKPSFGDINRSGVFQCVDSFDTVGIIARSLADLGLIRAGLMRLSPTTIRSMPVSSLRIGLCRTRHWAKCEPSSQDLITDATRQLTRAGANVLELELPAEFDEIDDLHRTVAGFEFARAITWERTEHAAKLSAALRNGRLADGLAVDYDAYVAAQQRLQSLRSSIADIMASYDTLLTPSARGEAPQGLQATGEAIFNGIWTALHVPAITVPAFNGPCGLPVGLQLVGRYRGDEALLATASSVAAALGLSDS